jgi:hypothetical protein
MTSRFPSYIACIPCKACPSSFFQKSWFTLYSIINSSISFNSTIQFMWLAYIYIYNHEKLRFIQVYNKVQRFVICIQSWPQGWPASLHAAWCHFISQPIVLRLPITIFRIIFATQIFKLLFVLGVATLKFCQLHMHVSRLVVKTLRLLLGMDGIHVPSDSPCAELLYLQVVVCLKLTLHDIKVPIIHCLHLM